MGAKIKVLIVDDHEMVRMGLKTYLSLEDHIEIVGEGCNGEEAIKLANELNPDVILMDLMMEKVNGIEATKQITSSNQNVKVIVLTSFIDDEMVFPVIEAGAFSYILKTTCASEIAATIEKAMKGEPTIEGKVASLMFNRMKEKPKHEALTKRESEVLSLLGEGKSNKEISDELHIGIKTVKTHVSNILSKLELPDRTQVAIYVNKHIRK
ncbi:response regulator transcription factor [Anaerobacillus isosaccharinicus]|uniref:Response regulator transcription factor n=2 Tax=Anaerobacillus isosaccharinicus TaxID=1532552 RepID=A0A7S7R9U2_9BACI|nr:response regulator transcription factor [Anaerobacillus isosaccharinicus]MBA5587666.1 response regulator transcription factor [Anaerobacillus isosaccharinicus]QOY34162.1 response regulator transcription factor [Anaerobacillus isosaccharinicus]